MFPFHPNNGHSHYTIGAPCTCTARLQSQCVHLPTVHLHLSSCGRWRRRPRSRVESSGGPIGGTNRVRRYFAAQQARCRERGPTAGTCHTSKSSRIPWCPPFLLIVPTFHLLLVPTFQALTAIVASLNPQASIIPCSFGVVSPVTRYGGVYALFRQYSS
jgi:hypothetical protein